MTDTAAYADTVFGLFWLLGYQFSPRLADIGDARFWRIDRTADYGVLNGLARHRIDVELIKRNWEDGSFCIKVRNATHGARARVLIKRRLERVVAQTNSRSFSFKVINSPMGTTTPTGRAFLQIQAAFAEMERNLIRQRIKESIVACRATIRFAGPPTIIFAGFAERGRTMGKLSWHGVFLK